MESGAAAPAPAEAWRADDQDILDQMNRLNAETAAAQPLVGPLENVEVLLPLYDGNAAFLPKIFDLVQKFSSLRRCRGDGTCLYRAAAVSLGEALVVARVRADGTGASPLQARYNRLRDAARAAPRLLASFIQGDVLDEFCDAWSAWLTGLGAPGATIESAVLAPLRGEGQGVDPQLPFYILYALRLLTSHEIRSNEENYLPYILGTSECFDAASFCSQHVEGGTVEADQVQAMALARALGVHLVIAYLDASPATEVSIITLPDAGEEGSPDLHLLYRPGHYDLVYPLPTAAGGGAAAAT